MIEDEMIAETPADAALTAKITRALRQSHRETLTRHKLLGQPIVTWDGEKVVEIAAEDIVIPPEEP